MKIINDDPNFKSVRIKPNIVLKCHRCNWMGFRNDVLKRVIDGDVCYIHPSCGCVCEDVTKRTTTKDMIQILGL